MQTVDSQCKLDLIAVQSTSKSNFQASDKISVKPRPQILPPSLASKTLCENSTPSNDHVLHQRHLHVYTVVIIELIPYVWSFPFPTLFVLFVFCLCTQNVTTRLNQKRLKIWNGISSTFPGESVGRLVSLDHYRASVAR